MSSVNRSIPVLEDLRSNSNNSNGSVTASYRFYSGRYVQKNDAIKHSHNGVVSLWAYDDGIKEPNHDIYGRMTGFYMNEYEKEDITSDVFIMARKKLGVCSTHCIPSYKLGKCGFKNKNQYQLTMIHFLYLNQM